MLLTNILLFDDRSSSRTAAAHMAMDEALLASASHPVLRVYRWASPVLSFGYFLPLASAQHEQLPGESLMRRWTGGGIVHHHTDFPWSLIIPHTSQTHSLPPRQSYAEIHAALARAMHESGVPSVQIDAAAPAPSAGLCFQQPAPGDLISAAGSKLAGAGQRRTRHGLLHQGTIQCPALPDNFPSLIASSLATLVSLFQPPPHLETDAATRTSTRYATDEWLRLR